MAGVEAAEGVAMMFGVHGGEEVSGGFMWGFLLPAAPVHKEAVAEAAKHPDDAHGTGPAHAALIVAVRNIQALVQAAFDTQAARLNSSHWAAFNSAGGRLVTSATVSGACWRRWRRRKPALRANRPDHQ